MAPKFLSFLSNKIQLLSAIASSTGASDADKVIATNSDGKIDNTFLNSTPEDTIALIIALG